MGNGDKYLGDLSHERAVWKIEHWGWAAFGLILASALAGVFGEGPLARGKAQTQGLGLEFDKLARYQAPSALKVHLGPSRSGSLPALELSRSFLEHAQVEHVTPEPERVKGTADSVIYIFDIPQTNQPTTVTIGFKPNGYGKTRGKIGLVDGPQLQFTQFIYP